MICAQEQPDKVAWYLGLKINAEGRRGGWNLGRLGFFRGGGSFREA